MKFNECIYTYNLYTFNQYCTSILITLHPSAFGSRHVSLTPADLMAVEALSWYVMKQDFRDRLNHETGREVDTCGQNWEVNHAVSV